MDGHVYTVYQLATQCDKMMADIKRHHNGEAFLKLADQMLRLAVQGRSRRLLTSYDAIECNLMKHFSVMVPTNQPKGVI